MSELNPGDRVETFSGPSADGARGTVRYVGSVDLEQGTWVGVELDDAVNEGSDGTHDNKRYFNCRPNHGTLIPIESVQAVNSPGIDAMSYEMKPDSINTSAQLSVNSSNANGYYQDSPQHSLQRKLGRRPSTDDIEKMGIVPPHYFADPFAAADKKQHEHDKVARELDDFFDHRHTPQQIESTNMVPANYFVNPDGSQRREQLLRERVTDSMTKWLPKRQSIQDLQQRNMIPTEYVAYDFEVANEIKSQRHNDTVSALEQKLDAKRRPSISDLGDMQIIPNEYIDDILTEAVIHHKRKESRVAHVTDKLVKQGFPEAVAGAVGTNLVDFVQQEEDKVNQAFQEMVTTMGGAPAHPNDPNYELAMEQQAQMILETMGPDSEWTISFFVDPFQGFVPMAPNTRSQTNQKLERRLSLRPSQNQIEVWGFVPPNYFDDPDVEEVIKAQQQRQDTVRQELNEKLNPNRRPSIQDLGNQNIIPENWLYDLYGLADDVRKKHQRMESAVADLKGQLNVPEVLADVVARDVLDEIETIEPTLDRGDGNGPPVAEQQKSRGSFSDDTNAPKPNPNNPQSQRIDTQNDLAHKMMHLGIPQLPPMPQIQVQLPNEVLQQIQTLHMYVNELQVNLVQRTEEVMQLTRSLQELSQNNVQFQERIQIARLNEQKNSQLIEQLNGQLQQYKNSNDATQQQPPTNNNNNPNTNNNNPIINDDTESKQTIAALEGEKQSLSDELQQIKAQLQNTQTELYTAKEFESQFNTANARVTELEDSTHRQRDELESKETIIGRLESDITNMEQNRHKLLLTTNEQMEQMRSYLKYYQKQLSGANSTTNHSFVG